MGRTPTLIGSLLLVVGVLAALAPFALGPSLGWGVGGAIYAVVGLGLLSWDNRSEGTRKILAIATFVLVVLGVILTGVLVNDAVNDPDPMTVDGVVMAHESWTNENGNPVALFWMAHDHLGDYGYLDDARTEALREHPYVYVGNRSDEEAVDKIGLGAFVRVDYTSRQSYSSCGSWTPVTPPSTTYRGEACVVNDLVMVIPGSASGDGSLAAVCEEANATACAIAQSESEAKAPLLTPIVVAGLVGVAALTWNRRRDA